MRIRNLVSPIVQACGLPVAWHVELAATLAQLGAVAVPADVLERAEGGLVLTVEERDLLARLPQIADRVLAGIPRIDEVRAAILSQGARFDGLAPNDKRAGAAIPFGGRVLRVAADFDILESAGRDPGDALAVMRRRLGVYDPALLEALESVLADRSRRVPHKLSTAELRPGMVLVEDVVTDTGLKLIAGGHELTFSMLERLANYSGMASGVREPIEVFVPSHPAPGASPDEG